MVRVLLALAIAACGSSKTTKQERLQSGDIAFVGATVVPMDREGTLADHTVVVRGDTIVLVAKSSTIDTTGANVIDTKGKWLVPGLADMHVHSWMDRDFAMYLLNGVTTIRDMFGSPQHLTWRADIAAGKLLGPTLITAGPIVDGNPPVWPGSKVVMTADEARAAVREQKAAGYDFIKVYNGLPLDAYEALVAEAKTQKLPFAGHVPKAVGLDKALESGQLTIEHLDGYLPFNNAAARVDAAIVATTAKSATWNCPTLVVTERFGKLDNVAALDTTPGLQYVAPAVRNQWDPKHDFRLQSWTPQMFDATRTRNKVASKLVVDLHKAGAKLVLGTDTGNPFVVPGFAVHDELALLVAAGLTRWQALRMATAAAAEVAGQPGSFGVIAPGARADLLVVDRDPLADLGALAQPSLVVVRGKLQARAVLLATVEGASKPPGDPYATLPALEVEGTKVAEARYEVAMNGSTIGHERVVISKLADGTQVIRGQAVYDMPKAVFQYRATADGVEFADGLAVTRKGGKVIAKPKQGAAVELAADASTVIAPQTIAEFIWYANRLATTPVGGSETIKAAEVMVEASVRLDPATFTFKRLPDAHLRVYEINGKHGELDLAGKFSVDSDGAPHEVSATIRWGTFVTRRLD
jgi:imidazolonepropionase-like amidohydrolase